MKRLIVVLLFVVAGLGAEGEAPHLSGSLVTLEGGALATYDGAPLLLHRAS